MYFKFGRYKIDGEFAENVTNNKGDNMDGKYINVIAENGCKASTETCHKCSSDGLARIQKRIKIYRSLIHQARKKNLQQNKLYQMTVGRLAEAEEILKILEEE